MESKYINYFFALKAVWSLHQEYGFGESPDLPSGFSESLCKSLFNLDESDSREQDAICSSGTVEIKATGSHEGKTTMSKSSNFDNLIWMFFDFKNDLLKVYKLPRSLFELDGSSGRKSIRLATLVKKNQVEPQIYRFSANNSHNKSNHSDAASCASV